MDLTKEKSPFNNVVLANYIEKNIDSIIETTNEDLNKVIDFVKMTIKNGTVNKGHMDQIITLQTKINDLINQREFIRNTFDV